MRYINNRYLKIAFGTILSVLITACSDWTDVESIDINKPHISETNPAEYAKYLENLRQYKNSDHNTVMVEFNNNNKIPTSRSQRVESIPDSVDIVLFTEPVLADWEISDIIKVRKDKATEFMFTIDFDKIKYIYDLLVFDRDAILDGIGDDEEEPAPLPSFQTYLLDTMQSTIALVDKYQYDGVCFNYKGKSTLHMTDEEVVEYTLYHNVFIGILKDWESRNANKKLLFSGMPQNLLDRSFLPLCHKIIINCNEAIDASRLDYRVVSACADEVPTDRFIVSAQTVSLDSSDPKTGYWADGVELAVIGTAEWVAIDKSDYLVEGILITNVSNDYFNSERTYNSSRNAIDIINPSIKN